MKQFDLVVLLVAAILCPISINCGRASLTNNGYTGVLIAIEPTVPEDAKLIEKIKEMITHASTALLGATRQRAYFKEVTILTPKTWTLGNYVGATTETYKLADIRIAPPNPKLPPDTPYASTSKKCGKSGKFIHLTPNYVTNDDVGNKFGPRGKTVVHEWGHYRWGIFDEYSTTKKFYLNLNKYPEATRCSTEIRGKMEDAETGGPCVINIRTRKPEPPCEFYDDPIQSSGLKASMMYRQFLSQVTTFCHSDDSDPVNLHNKVAPNSQNERCDHQSTWDVIMQSEDFQNGNINLPNPLITDTTPEFKVLRAVPRRFVFVMDTSSSMKGSKLDNLRSATKHLINVIQEGTFVGLVSFESTSLVLANPSQLNTKKDRKSLVNFIPGNAGGGSAIGLGIQNGILALQREGKSPKGGTIIVFTDGEEHEKPLVEDVASEVISSGVVVNAIFIGLNDVHQDASLVNLCKSTSGIWANVDDTIQTGSQLNNVLASLTRNDDGDLSNELVQISNQAMDVESGTAVQLSTAVDGSVGSDTTFTFSWSYREPKIEIIPPGRNCVFSNSLVDAGKSYCTENPIHEVNNQFKSIIFTVPGTAQIGRWNYNISSDIDDVITVAVVSASSGEAPVTVETSLSITSVDGNGATIVEARVFQNLLPVLGASVTARIIRPIKDDFVTQLFDNGAGADGKGNDGVYSRYFAKFNAQGRYYVEVNVTKNGNDQEDYVTSSLAGSLINDPGDGKINSQIIGAKIEGVLERVASTPGLQYNGLTPTGDIFPPNRITDLSVSQVNLDKASDGVVLEFTAPGDDYDNGKASSYEIRYSKDDIFNLLNNFTDELSVSEASLINGSLDSPKSAMSKEIFYFNITDLSADVDSVRISFAVRAFDEVGNPSKVSNLALVIFFIKPPPIITTDDDAGVDMKLIIILGGAIVLIAIYKAVLCCKHRKKYNRYVPGTGLFSSCIMIFNIVRRNILHFARSISQRFT